MYLKCLTYTYTWPVYVISLSSVSVSINTIVWAYGSRKRAPSKRAHCTLFTINTIYTDFGLELCFCWNKWYQPIQHVHCAYTLLIHLNVVAFFFAGCFCVCLKSHQVHFFLPISVRVSNRINKNRIICYLCTSCCTHKHSIQNLFISHQANKT